MMKSNEPDQQKTPADSLQHCKKEDLAHPEMVFGLMFELVQQCGAVHV